MDGVTGNENLLRWEYFVDLLHKQNRALETHKGKRFLLPIAFPQDCVVAKVKAIRTGKK